jgi:protocatechuate 3,4-dioxygenase beta subunit
VTGGRVAGAGQGSIAGRVVDGAGRPIAGATVAVTGGSQPYRDIAAVTKADGRFHFGRMHPGQYRLAARAKDELRSADVVVAADQQADVEIRLDD